MPHYIRVSREGMRLHLTEHHGDCSPGSKVFIDCQGLPEYHRELLEKSKHSTAPVWRPRSGTA